MKWFVAFHLVLGLSACGFQGVKGCPPKTAQVTADCHADVAKGLKTKAQCEQEIEESCP